MEFQELYRHSGRPKDLLRPRDNTHVNVAVEKLNAWPLNARTASCHRPFTKVAEKAYEYIYRTVCEPFVVFCS